MCPLIKILVVLFVVFKNIEGQFGGPPPMGGPGMGGGVGGGMGGGPLGRFNGTTTTTTTTAAPNCPGHQGGPGQGPPPQFG